MTALCDTLSLWTGSGRGQWCAQRPPAPGPALPLLTTGLGLWSLFPSDPQVYLLVHFFLGSLSFLGLKISLHLSFDEVPPFPVSPAP